MRSNIAFSLDSRLTSTVSQSGGKEAGVAHHPLKTKPILIIRKTSFQKQGKWWRIILCPAVDGPLGAEVDSHSGNFALDKLSLEACAATAAQFEGGMEVTGPQ